MRKSDNTLHFFINGEDVGKRIKTIPTVLYGVVDLFGQAEEVTITGKFFVLHDIEKAIQFTLRFHEQAVLYVCTKLSNIYFHRKAIVRSFHFAASSVRKEHTHKNRKNNFREKIRSFW